MENKLQKKRFNLYLGLSLISFALFLITMILVLTVDVQNAGVNGTSIGLATINTKIFSILKTNSFWQGFTDALGYGSIIIIAYFAIVGLIQLIKRRSIKAVDKEIIIMGVMFILLIIIYVFFELVTINYRPVLIDDKIEASFPSSHTMLIVSVLGILSVKFDYSIDNKISKWIYIIINALVSLLAIVGRLLSGVHWFTDIVAGVLISLFVIFLFKILILKFKSKN